MLVLVADDDRAVREALERALQLAGYEVELGAGGGGGGNPRPRAPAPPRGGRGGRGGRTRRGCRRLSPKAVRARRPARAPARLAGTDARTGARRCPPVRRPLVRSGLDGR